MKLFHKYIYPQIPIKLAALLLVAGSLVSCNAHQQFSKLIGHSVKESMSKLVQKEPISIKKTIDPIENLSPSATLSDIIVEKTELIATY